MIWNFTAAVAGTTCRGSLAFLLLQRGVSVVLQGPALVVTPLRTPCFPDSRTCPLRAALSRSSDFVLRSLLICQVPASFCCCLSSAASHGSLLPDSLIMGAVCLQSRFLSLNNRKTRANLCGTVAETYAPNELLFVVAFWNLASYVFIILHVGCIDSELF